MPRRDFSAIAAEKQEQRVIERPKIEQTTLLPVKEKQVKTSVPPSSSTGKEYSKYSTIAAAYAQGRMPKRHAALYNGICKALGPDVKEGEINMGLILEEIDMNRKSAANIIGHLENFGFIHHERRPRGTYIEILK